MKLKMMTFNMRYDNPEDGVNRWANRVELVAQVIADERPSILGTQEMLPGMLQTLEEKLGNYRWIGVPRLPNDEHTVIFYDHERLQLSKSGTFWLSETPLEPGSKSWGSALPRICTWGEFTLLQSAERFRVFNTHLDHLSESARINGSKVIRDFIRRANESDNLPTVIMGDFNNDTRDSEEICLWECEEKFASVFSALGSETGMTRTFHDFSGGELGEAIDHIFVSPEVRLTEGGIYRKKINGFYPSDHYPVWAVIEAGNTRDRVIK